MKTLIGIAAFLFSISLLSAENIEGEWKKTDGSGRIIFSVDEKGKLSGTISYVKDVSRTHDSNNPDPKLRKRKLLGLKIADNFYKKGKKNVWQGGSIYDSQTGKTYKGKIWLENSDNLRMRGFVGVSLIGRTADFKRHR